MQHIEKISTSQFMVLVFLYTIGTTILVIPSGLAGVAKQDAWIGVIAGLILNIGIVYIFIKLWSMFPEQSFVEICDKVLGKYLGKLFSVFFIFYSFIGSTTVLFYVGDFVSTEILVETPASYIQMTFAIVLIMGVGFGIEVIARTAEIFLPWFILLFMIFIVLIIPSISLELVTPIFESGFKPILQNALAIAGTSSLPFLSFFMIFPKINNLAIGKKVFYLATISGGMVILIITFLSITVIGPELTAHNMYPTYTLAKKIGVGNFLQRIEVIISILWIVSTYFKLIIYFYGLVISISILLKITDYKILLYPIGMIVYAVSLFVYPDVIYMMDWDSTVFIPYIFTIGLLLPLILLLIGFIKNRTI
jgi:spore germination protein KB